MKIFFVFLLCLLSSVTFQGQEKNQIENMTPSIDINFNDGCGNPFVESQTYGYRRGKIIQVGNSNELVVKVWNPNNVWNDKHDESSENESRLIKYQIFRVKLVGIDESVNKKAIAAFLRERVLNTQVEIIGNTKKKNSRKIEALVRFNNEEEFDDISEYLLENGIAKFKDFQLGNLVPMRTACELRRAEEKAKKENLGI